MDYKALEEHIKDSVMEEQAKLGFRKEVIRLYYPVGMLNNLFGTDYDAEEMQKALTGFAGFVKERLGEIMITHKERAFLSDPSRRNKVFMFMNIKRKMNLSTSMVNLIASHETDMEQVKKLFKQQPYPSDVEQMKGGEFDMVIHFTEGDDRYYYCFKDEGFHITYHRFLPADYKDLGV